MAVAREPLRGLGKPESGSELKRLAEGHHNKAQIKPPAPGTRTGPRRPPGAPRAPQGPQPIGPGGQRPRGGPRSPVPKTPNPDPDPNPNRKAHAHADGIVIVCEVYIYEEEKNGKVAREDKSTGSVVGMWTEAKQRSLGHLHDNLVFGTPLPGS